MVYAIADKIPKHSQDYLTPGRKYEIIDYDSLGFSIIDDKGQKTDCLWKGCAHIEADWKSA